jgi:hypothetical protein
MENLVGKFFKRNDEFGIIISIHGKLYFHYDNEHDYDDCEQIIDNNFEIIQDYKLKFIKPSRN